MNLETLLVIVGSAISFLGIIPYLRDVVKKKTKPRVVTWLNWTILTIIAGAGALADHQYPAAVLSFTAALETLLITVLGFHHGDRRFDRTDVLCQVGALVGLFLWYIFNSPGVAILAIISIEIVAGFPTYKHSWQKPWEETLITFVLASVGSAIVLASVREFSVTSLAYPVYLLIANLVFVSIISFRRARLAGA